MDYPVKPRIFSGLLERCRKQPPWDLYWATCTPRQRKRSVWLDSYKYDNNYRSISRYNVKERQGLLDSLKCLFENERARKSWVCLRLDTSQTHVCFSRKWKMKDYSPIIMCITKRIDRLTMWILWQSWNRFILHQIHYEILETRKRQQEEEEAARLKSGSKYPPFVYNEQDFPSILEDLGSRYRSHDDERKRKRKQEEDGKYMWITSKGKHNLCVTPCTGHFLCLFFNLYVILLLWIYFWYWSPQKAAAIYPKNSKRQLGRILHLL